MVGFRLAGLLFLLFAGCGGNFLRAGEIVFDGNEEIRALH